MNHAVVYFDGVCNFCNGFVNFLIRHDKKDFFRYCPLQSDRGTEFLRANNLPIDNPGTFFLELNGKIYSRSTAALLLFKNLGWQFRWLYAFIIIPETIRDAIFYNPIARNRYKWFGKKDSCMVPDEKVRSKFI